jgi:hypothetical protein
MGLFRQYNFARVNGTFRVNQEGLRKTIQEKKNKKARGYHHQLYS